MSKLAQTHVWHNGQRFFVSTEDRASSALAAYGLRYAETLAWSWPDGDERRGAIVGQESSGQGSLYGHFKLVERLLKTGKGDEPEEESE